MDPRDLLAAAPCNGFFGFRLLRRSAERVELELPMRAAFAQEAGVVQGGILTALADTAAVYLLWPDLGPARTMTGTGCTMQFLAAADPAGPPLRATAVPLRTGRTIAVCESTIEQGPRLVAKGTFSFLLRDRRL